MFQIVGGSSSRGVLSKGGSVDPSHLKKTAHPSGERLGGDVGMRGLVGHKQLVLPLASQRGHLEKEVYINSINKKCQVNTKD